MFVSEHSHSGARLRFMMESTGDGPKFIPEEALMRFACHLLIEHLPMEAIPEVWENIRDSWEWHFRPRLPAAPSHRIVGAGVPVGAPVDAPPLKIEEE